MAGWEGSEREGNLACCASTSPFDLDLHFWKGFSTTGLGFAFAIFLFFFPGTVLFSFARVYALFLFARHVHCHYYTQHT